MSIFRVPRKQFYVQTSGFLQINVSTKWDSDKLKCPVYGVHFRELDYIHDIDYWTKIVSASRNAEVLSVKEMESNEEVWNDWLQQENEYAVGDRKAINAGGGKYLNFIAIVLKKK